MPVHGWSSNETRVGILRSFSAKLSSEVDFPSGLTSKSRHLEQHHQRAIIQVVSVIDSILCKPQNGSSSQLC